MSRYKINVKVELVECDDFEPGDLTKNADDSFSMTISEQDAISIDKVDSSVLQTSYPAMREAVSKHLTQISKKKACETSEGGEVIANCYPYKVDGEVGRFEFVTHSIVQDNQVLSNTASDIFPGLRVNEFYRTSGFKEIAMIYGDIEESYRKTGELINRNRHQQEGGTPYRTLQENTQIEGIKLLDHIEDKSRSILEVNGFAQDGTCGENIVVINDQPATLAAEQIAQAYEKCCAKHNVPIDVLSNPVVYENPANTVNTAIDDVNVKKQKEDRKQCADSEEQKKKYVHNTVAHVEKSGLKYVLNGYGIKSVLCFLLALILHNGLWGCRFQFFTDGHKTLNESILKFFCWYKNIGIILDWYHLEKKCKETLSLAMNGRILRNKLLEDLMPLLWYGLTDKAIAVLEGIGAASVKNREQLEKLIEYLERNKPYIPCYEIRKELGLRNSSAIGEKMNDLVVSDRQKNNGMSWSKNGSVALAAITALKRNKEHKRWFEKGEIDFKLAA